MNSSLILGTAQFGLNYGINNKHGKPSDAELISILDYAYTNGIVILDTAEAYGDAQERIGIYHRGVDHRFNIITKFSSNIDLPSEISERLEHNLVTLNVTSFYSYMFHSFDDYRKFYPRFSRELNYQVNNRVINKIGVSVYTNEEAMGVLEDESIRLIQMPFNLLDNYSKRKSVLKKAYERGVEIHTRSVFLQGLLFRDLSQTSGCQQQLKPYLKSITRLLNNNDLSMMDLAINYAISQKLISKVLIGVDSVSQLQANIDSTTSIVENYLIEQIDKIDVKEIDLLNPVNWK